jgi:hypothetical protein
LTAGATTIRHAKKRGTGLRTKTVKKIIGVLSVILSEALEDGLIAVHPAEKMRRHYRSADLRDAKVPVCPPDRATVAAILEKARTHAITRKGKVRAPLRRPRRFHPVPGAHGVPVG